MVTSKIQLRNAIDSLFSRWEEVTVRVIGARDLRGNFAVLLSDGTYALLPKVEVGEYIRTQLVRPHVEYCKDSEGIEFIRIDGQRYLPNFIEMKFKEATNEHN